MLCYLMGASVLLKVLSDVNNVLIFREMITKNRIKHHTDRSVRDQIHDTTTIPSRTTIMRTAITLLVASARFKCGRTKYRVNGSPDRSNRKFGPSPTRPLRLSPL